MKKVWKRSLSLLLSGVLLLSNVPVQALATEEEFIEELVEEIVLETEPKATEPQEVKTQETKPQEVKPAAEVKVTDSVKSETPPEPEAVKYPVKIDGIQLTDQSVLDGTYSYDDNAKTLTLKGAELKSVHVEEDVTIKLAEETESEIKESLSGDANITIEGNGKLTVTQIQTDENLTINAVVVAGKARAEAEEQKNVIEVKNEVVFAEPAHLRLNAEGHTAIFFTDTENSGKLTGAGYYRNTVDNGFASMETQPDSTSGGYFEFVSEGHIGADYFPTEDGAKHYRTCKDDTCSLREGVMIDLSDHNLGYTSSDKTIRAECSVCGAYKTFTLEVSNSEWGTEVSHKVNAEGVLNISKPTITYQQNEVEVTDIKKIGAYTAVISLGDKTVKADFSVTTVDFSKAEVTGGTYTYNGQAHEPAAGDVTVTLNGKTLDSLDYVITSYTNNINAGQATMTLESTDSKHYAGTAVGKFTINPDTLEASDVKLSPEKLTYNGEAQAPEVIKTDADSDVEFVVAEHEPTINVGEYTLKVEGKNNYQGSVELKYWIEAAEAELMPMEPQNIAIGSGAFTEPVYKVGEKEVEGTFYYTFGEVTDVEYDAAKDELASMTDAEEVTIAFSFKPDVDGNISNTEIFTDKFVVKMSRVRFLINNAAITDQDVVAADLTYGVAEPVSTDRIEAYVNDQKVQTQGEYNVTYTDAVTNAPVEGESLNVGKYKFAITYTGTVGDVYCQDYPVYAGEHPFEITAKKIIITKSHTATHLTYKKDEKQPLLTGVVRADVTAEDAFEWSYQVNGAASVKDVPEYEAVGVYEITYYAKSKSVNYTDSEKVTEKVAILPVLQAEYGKYLKDIDLTGTGFEWDEQANPKNTTLVGNVNDTEAKRTFILESPKLSNIPVVITVLPKKLTPTVTLNDKDGYIHYDDRLKNNLIVKDGATGDILKYGKDYTLGYAGTASGLKYQYTVKDLVGGNYEIKETSIVANLYRQSYNTLVEANFPKDDLAGTANSTLEKVKTTLTAKVKATDYPETAMKYFSTYVTKIENKTWVEYRNKEAFPPDGVDYVISYAQLNATKNDKFKVSVMDTFGENAGKEAKVITATKTDEGLKIHLDDYSAVCVAKQVKVTDATKETEETKSEYKVSVTPSSYGTVKFRVGSNSTLKTSANVKVGETLTITATPNSNYAVTKVQYTYKDGATTKLATLTQNSSGEYKMKMPAKDITFRATFAKKTSSSKNPYSGDTSNIYLWITVLALSAAAIVALMAFWFKKRKK